MPQKSYFFKPLMAAVFFLALLPGENAAPFHSHALTLLRLFAARESFMLR